jgi:hypothetical protein
MVILFGILKLFRMLLLGAERRGQRGACANVFQSERFLLDKYCKEECRKARVR